MRYFHVGLDKLDTEELWNIAKGKKIKVESEVLKKVKANREVLENLIKKDEMYYGINTGVGRFADKKLSLDELKDFQKDLIISHTSGYGAPLKKEIVRMAMFLRLYMLSRGYSGVRPEVVLKLEEFLNKDIVPYVPSFGSVGASGDLIPLSHIAMALIGGGMVFHDDRLLPTYVVLKSTNTKPLEMEYKEALALINGTQVSLALLVYVTKYLETILSFYDKAFLLSFVAIDGNPDIFNESLITLRNSKSEKKFAKIYREFLKDYRFERKKKLVQDPYSFRCMPQIRGSTDEVFEFCKKIIEDEIESVSDNPLILDEKVISGGNFIGIRLSFAAENLKKIISVLSNVSERRINHLMGSEVVEMPKFLSAEPGKKSGLMILHVLVASLVSYIKTLTFPDLSDSIPTSQNQEDYVPMTMNSCLKLLDILDKFKVITLSELYASTRALLLLKKKIPSKLDDFLSSNFEDLKIFTDDLAPFEVLRRIEKILNLENI
ncbi:MAG: aromatic amino acid ammonia-lyase [Candidatus Hydrothermales bacterium]